MVGHSVQAGLRRLILSRSLRLEIQRRRGARGWCLSGELRQECSESPSNRRDTGEATAIALEKEDPPETDRGNGTTRTESFGLW
ncbi:hypothetical protein M5K25_004916 [Dendrobium thyrsiflorum]|uniref:Uncharacterized protein n=1 Tax=Dendrobium thyrsiflorum TaxID=117978 RepID=A0ABD0VG38_DENTH